MHSKACPKPLAALLLQSLSPIPIHCTLLLLLIHSPTLFAAHRFVSPSGNNSNDGTLSHPWKSVSYSIQQTLPGDIIWLRGGQYEEGEIWIRDKAMGGTPGSHKTIQAYPGEHPSLGGNRRLINQADWIRFQNLEFRLPYTFDNNDGNHVQILNCTFEGPQPAYGAITFQGNHGLIQGNVIRITTDSLDTRDHGIYLLHGSNNVLRGNSIFQPTGYGIHVYDEPKSEDPPGFVRNIENIRVEANYVEGSRHRSGMIFTSFGSASLNHVLLRGNITHSNNHIGIIIDRASDIHCANNTFHANGRQGLHISPQARQILIRSNLFVQFPQSFCNENCSWYQARHVEISKPESVPLIDHNFYSPALTPDDSLQSMDLHPHAGDPNLGDPFNQDFRPHLPSPACPQPGHFGAMPGYGEPHEIIQELMLDQGTLVWRAFSQPDTQLALQSSPTLTSPNTPWIDTAHVAQVHPTGAFQTFPNPSPASSPTFFRCTTFSPSPSPSLLLTPKSTGINTKSVQHSVQDMLH